MKLIKKRLIMRSLAIAGALMWVGVQAIADEAAKPTISVSGAQVATSDSSYYIVGIPETGTTTVTLTASGTTPALANTEKCKCTYDDRLEDPDKDGTLKYTFTKPIGDQDPVDGPTVKINISSSTPPGEYKFKVTNIEQKYKACATDWTGGITTKSNTQESDEVTVLVYKIETETVATTPSDRKRTTIGIGEEVNLKISPTSASASWSITSGGGSIATASGNTTKFTAPLSSGTTVVTATIKGIDTLVSFSMIAPNGLNAALNTDLPYTSGTTKIGSHSFFDCVVLPTTVSFSKVQFRENIPGEQWTWPDGTAGRRAAKIVPFTVGPGNKCNDDVATGLYPIERLKRNGSYVSFSISIRVPEEYKDDNGNWIVFLGTEKHPRQYRGTDQQGRRSIIATNIANGGWMGPFQ